MVGHSDAAALRRARSTHRTLSTKAVAANDRMWDAKRRYGERSAAYRLAARRFKVAHDRLKAAARRLQRLGD